MSKPYQCQCLRRLTGATIFRPIRLFSSTPILSSRETRLGFEREWSRRRPKPLPKFPPSTADRYFFPSTASLKPGESSTTTTSGELRKSFIFDLPNLKYGQEGFESFRGRRLRVFREKIRAERTLKREMEDARWFADPWYRMKKTPPRMCIVTRNSLPSAFLISFKPVHRANEQDNPGSSPPMPSNWSEDDADVGGGIMDLDVDLKAATQTSIKFTPDSASDDDTLHSPDGVDQDERGPSEQNKRASKRPTVVSSSPAHLPSATLVPHNVLHPKFSPARGGRSVYVTARRDVVEELQSATGSHIPELLKMARTLYRPPLLLDMIQSQLEQRVVQELEMLHARIRATAADPQGKIRSGFQRSTKRRSRESEESQVGIEELPPTTKSAQLDPSWMQSINGDKALLYRLSVNDAECVRAGEGCNGDNVIAMLDMEGLDATPVSVAMAESGSVDDDSALVNNDLAQISRESEGEAQTDQLVSMIAGPKGETPLFHLRTLLPSALHEQARTLLGAILGIETMIKARMDARKLARQSTKDAGGSDKVQIVDASVSTTGETDPSQASEESKLALKSNLLALNSWAAPKGLTGRRGDLGVPLFIALYRLRLWYGEGWTQKLINQRGYEV